MITIGLDLSINSTGVCVCRDGAPTRYHLIVSDKSITKKVRKVIDTLPDLIEYHIYTKDTSGTDYESKEIAKTNNINVIGDIIDEIIDEERPDCVFIEGISYGSIGSVALVDLSGLNFIIRRVLRDRGVYWEVVSPTRVKRNACGNGAAHKDEMVYAWLKCDSRLEQYKSQLKIDDLADSYFLAMTPTSSK